MSRREQKAKHNKESQKKEVRNKKNTKEKKSRIEQKEKKAKKRLKEENLEYRLARKNKKKDKGIISRFFGKVLFFIFVLLLVFVVVFSAFTYKNGWGIRGALMTAFFVSENDLAELETVNIVLLGISEDLNSKLTDTIMLCSYNPKTSNISMISIPRDTFVGDNIELAKGSDKLNVLFNKNKNSFLKEISSIVGFDVNYYAVVNNEALIKIVDIMGGVKFDIPIDMDYDDPTQDLHIHLKKGMQLVDGEKAEQLLRFRHNNDGSSYPGNYGDNDFGRMKTQRLFMEAIVKQAISFKTIFRSANIYNAVIENIDTNYEIKNIKNYIPTLADFNFEKIISNQLPGKSERHNEVWFYIQDKNKTKQLIKELEIN